MVSIEYLPKALAAIRAKKGRRVQDLATRARMSERQIRALERGAIPRADTLAKLAMALGVSIRAFYGERRRS